MIYGFFMNYYNFVAMIKKGVEIFYTFNNTNQFKRDSSVTSFSPFSSHSPQIAGMPMYKGILRDLWGISKILLFPDFVDQLTQKIISQLTK